MYFPEPSKSGAAQRRAPDGPARVPDVTLRVLRDGTCIEVLVSGSDAPPSPTFEIDEALLESALDELARSIGAERRLSSPNLPKRVSPRPLEELLPEEGARAVRRLVAIAFRDGVPASGTYESEVEDERRRFSVRVIPNEGDAVVTLRDVTVDDPALAIEEALDRGDLSLRYTLRLDAALGVQAIVARTFVAEGEALRPLAGTDRVAGLRARVDDWAVHEAVRHLAWASSSGLPVLIALPVSREWITRGDAAATTKGLLGCYSAPSAGLEFRLAYDEWAMGPEEVMEAATEIRRLGARVSLTGVGTHSIDIAELALMQVDAWICDGDLVRRSGDNLSDGVLEALTVLARACGARPIAGGIDDQRAVAYLRDLGYCGFEGPFGGDHREARDAFRKVRSRPSTGE